MDKNLCRDVFLTQKFVKFVIPARGDHWAARLECQIRSNSNEIFSDFWQHEHNFVFSKTYNRHWALPSLLVNGYCPPIRRCSLLRIGEARMRKISCRMICYYLSWNHLHNQLVYYTLLEMLDVFRPCVLAELSVTPTCSSPVSHDRQ
jgi:hypothetical protein